MKITLNRYNKIYVCLFFIILVLPSTLMFFVPADVSVENRGLTPWPTEIKAMQDYETAILDRIALRKGIIQISSFIDYRLFHKSITDNVIIGDNGQLFYAGGDYKADMKGELKLSEEQINAIVDVQNEIVSQMDKRGIKYVILVAPDKHNIYVDDVPDAYKNINNSKTAKEQVIEALKTRSNVEILDLQDVLFLATKSKDTYLKTDSHWNQEGAFIGYQELIKYLQKYYPNIKALEKKDFTISYEKENNQNLAKMLSLGNLLYDDNSVRYYPLNPGEGIVEDFNPGYPDPNWYSPAFYMINTRQEDSSLPKVVMYRDSFAGLDGWLIGNLNRYLSVNCSRFASYSTHQVDFNYIDTEKADVVIFELLESNITHLAIDWLDNNELSKDKPLYRYNTPLNGDYYVEDKK